MYTAKLDGKTLYYPGDSEAMLMDPKVKLKVGYAGSFGFTIPASHPLCNSIHNRNSMVSVYRGTKEIFYGEVRSLEKKDKYNNAKYYCVGAMSFLADSIQPQAEYHNMTVIGFLQTLLDNHNAQVEARKQFKLGAVSVKDSNDSLYRYTNFENTLDCIRVKLVDKLGGHLRVRHESDGLYLDYLYIEDYGVVSSQPIEFGMNLLDYAESETAEELYTAIIPLGARIQTDTEQVLEKYTDITSVNDGLNYIYSQDAVEQFGWVWKVVYWDDVTEPANLKPKGEDWLSNNQFQKLTLLLTAIDLSDLGTAFEAFDCGDRVLCTAKPYGMNATLPIMEMEIPLERPDNRTITVGAEVQTFTDSQNKVDSELSSQIQQGDRNMLIEAVKNATALITTAMGGYVVKTENELLIMDTNDINTATKVWRWNINGLGYSSTGYKGPYTIAMTMDGGFVADFITSGTMSANRIQGGELILGGSDNKYGILRILNEKGVQVGGWDMSGITLPPGTKISWSQVTETDNVATTDDVPTKTSQLTNDSGFAKTSDIPTNSEIVTLIYNNRGTIITKDYIATLKVIAGGVDVEAANNNEAIINLTGTTYQSKIAPYYARFISNNAGVEVNHSGIGWVDDMSSNVWQFGHHVDFENGRAYFSGSSWTSYFGGVRVEGNLTVDGTKSRLANTENYSDRLLYCYEAAAPMFGDVGEGRTDETGTCYVFIEDIFSETVDLECNYQVFLQPYGEGNIYVAERTPAYFVVKGDCDIAFGWELKAVQNGYDSTRLGSYEETEKTTDYASEALDYIDTLLYDVEKENAYE